MMKTSNTDMTNKPTIDGVSRELLEESWSALMQKGKVLKALQIRDLLDAPVVERQPVDDEQWWADTPDGHSALVTRVGALTEWQRGRDGMRDERDAAQAEVAALQSTIAQLQARIAELESFK